MGLKYQPANPAGEHPSNESDTAFPLGDFASPDVDMDVAVSSEGGVHVINVTLSSAEDGRPLNSETLCTKT